MQVITVSDAIKDLEKEYPDVFPRIDKPMSDFEQGKYLGCREIIEHLRGLVREVNGK